MKSETLLIIGRPGGRCEVECADRLQRFLRARLDIRVQRAATVQPAIDEAAPAAILLLGDSGEEIVGLGESVRQRQKQVPLLGLLHSNRELPGFTERFISLLKDHLVCPFQNEDLLARVRRLVFQPAARVPAPANAFTETLLGESACFRAALDSVRGIARADATCVIEGETGTGKELFARATHYLSARRSSPFVPLNCGALPDNLIDNELFGHVQGAYTDAKSNGQGLLAYAENGTLFLDEVDTLSVSAQVKLLRVLQEGEYRRVGSALLMKAEARIVAATNANLREKVAQGSFREDLFHRLNILRLRVPPLRDRNGDRMLLALHFLTRYCAQHRIEKSGFGEDAVRLIESYAWPGNVRELQAAIQRAVLLGPETLIHARDLDIQSDPFEPHPETLSAGLRLAKTECVDSFERSYLVNLLCANDGNVSRSAKAAGKDRRSFQRLLKKHQIERDPAQV